ncbi:hypothetical protein XSR1_200066 [Xenorhabdus szentirmaii DSM 16338]|uniref:Uncharacterized protein n=1 Tax=Xenorhabdus szentirmaii DSM 16338 TaxID=1427518 RepID=W1IVM8_9GAMM|nr:hypothetical protein XSR1_200066 [Xenorhabdus szentirmaii DSM 16338]
MLFFAEQAYGVTPSEVKRFLSESVLLSNDQKKLGYMDLNTILAAKI